MTWLEIDRKGLERGRAGKTHLLNTSSDAEPGWQSAPATSDQWRATLTPEERTK